MKLKLGILLTIFIFLTACGGSGGSSSSGPDIQIRTGKLDNGLVGMDYESGDTSGKINSNGEFMYEEIDGVVQDVRFFVDGVEIATIEARELLTLLDLVANGSADSVELQNIVAFFMLLDEDQNPSNGFTLSSALLTFLENNDWMPISFTASDFANQTALATIIADLSSIEGDVRALPSSSEASSVVQLGYWCSASGLYAGTYDGGDEGTFVVAIDSANGNVGGWVYSELDQATLLIDFLSGSPLTVDLNSGFIAGNVSTASYSGSLTNFNELEGTWSNPQFSINGDFEGVRVIAPENEAFRFSILYFNDAAGGNPFAAPANYGLIQVNVDSNNNVNGIMVDAGGVETVLEGTLTMTTPNTASNLSLASSNDEITLTGILAFNGEQNPFGDTPAFYGSWTNSNIGIGPSDSATAVAFGSGCQPF